MRNMRIQVVLWLYTYNQPPSHPLSLIPRYTRTHAISSLILSSRVQRVVAFHSFGSHLSLYDCYIELNRIHALGGSHFVFHRFDLGNSFHETNRIHHAQKTQMHTHKPIRPFQFEGKNLYFRLSEIM